MKKLNSILLIDDDSVTNYLHKTIITDLEITDDIVIIDNGEDAFQYVKQNCFEGQLPDLILLDINMPIASGYEFLEAYKLLGAMKKDIVLVVLTSSALSRDLEKVKAYDATDYMVKPLTKEKISDLIFKYFN